MKHSMQEVLKIQKDFEARFGQTEGVTGIGICANPHSDDLALNVLVTGDKEAANLPKTFNGLDIVIDITGVTRAY